MVQNRQTNVRKIILQKLRIINQKDGGKENWQILVLCNTVYTFRWIL